MPWFRSDQLVASEENAKAGLPAKATIAAKIRLKLQLLQDADHCAEARIRCSVKRNAQVRAMIQLDCHGVQYEGSCRSVERQQEQTACIRGCRKAQQVNLPCCRTCKAKIGLCMLPHTCLSQNTILATALMKRVPRQSLRVSPDCQMRQQEFMPKSIC